MITFYISEAFRIFRKSGYNSFVLIFVTSLAAIVSVASIFIVYEVNSLDKNLKSGIKLNVFIQPELSGPKIDSIKVNLLQIDVVKKVEFISKESATDKFIKETGEDFKQVLDENPLPNSYIVSLDASKVSEVNIDNIVGNIKHISGIDDVIYDYDTTLKLLRLLKMIQYFFYPLALILVTLSVYLVYSNNKLQIKQNHNLYNTMNLVGGKISSIRIPIIINGFLIGIVSSIICMGIVSLVMFILTASVNSLKLSHYFLHINVLISAISISLGFLGSFLSSRNFFAKI
jgi:cell division transport system permease protein